LKYKKYFRKSSIKKKIIGDLFLKEIQKKNPKKFLEIGIFHGVTARNVCDLMYRNHGLEFEYIGIDIFEEGDDFEKEVAPSYKFNNPLKSIYFKYFKRLNPYSVEAVEDLLKKYKKNINIIKGNTNIVLKKLNLTDVDYIFIDGGHDYNTVKNDLEYSKNFLSTTGVILCDDYNLTYAPGVKKAIDEFVSENTCKHEVILDRFAKIEF
tara:strand:+ start:614 stop:1237 length:624 start_codon:yes stop_codon:yes gene_type:complete